MSNATVIASLNDTFRSSFLGGRIVMTEGITSLPDNLREQVVMKVRSFTEFGERNDPYGEHDFGSFEVACAGNIFWKIDYYDEAMECISPDPSDPNVTVRVLTIMLAKEY